MKCDCGYDLKVSKSKTLFYALFNKEKRYVQCNNCQKVHCVRLISHIVKDNDDSKLKSKNCIKKSTEIFNKP